jgi:hypothetical protein
MAINSLATHHTLQRCKFLYICWTSSGTLLWRASTCTGGTGENPTRTPQAAPSLSARQLRADNKCLTVRDLIRLESTHRLYELERQKIEDEFKRGREAVRQRLLDQVEERRRKIKEEKESTGDIVAGMFPHQ